MTNELKTQLNIVEAQARLTRASIRATGMQAENQQRAFERQPPMYLESHFENIIHTERCSEQAIWELLNMKAQ